MLQAPNVGVGGKDFGGKEKSKKHPKCLGEDYYSGPSETSDFGCGYNTSIDCGECKYGAGRKNPEAKCNQL